MRRLAIYFTPPPHSPLARMAASWLGRDPHTGEAIDQPTVDGLSPERLRQITSAPRHYGFHATLKPPFRLAPGTSAAELFGAVGELAGTAQAIVLPPLRLTLLQDFLCLVPEHPCPGLARLARRTVQDLDSFRARPDEAEIQKRRQVALTASQEEMLRSWGYPYVLDEFRFHLTLTGRLAESREREIILAELDRRFGPLLKAPLLLDVLTVFEEVDGQPMTVIASYPLQMNRQLQDAPRSQPAG